MLSFLQIIWKICLSALDENLALPHAPGPVGFAS